MKSKSTLLFEICNFVPGNKDLKSFAQAFQLKIFQSKQIN